MERLSVARGMSTGGARRGRSAAISGLRKRIMTGVRFLFRVTLRRHDLAAEIAQGTRYSHASHFIRAFKRWTGVTPQSFRDSLPSSH